MRLAKLDLKLRRVVCVGLGAALVAAAWAGGDTSKAQGAGAAAGKEGSGKTAGARYYFQVFEVQSTANVDEAIKTAAKETLEKDLLARSEFTADLGSAKDDEAIVAELKKRKLQGFKVSLRLDEIRVEKKDPKPGGRLPQLALTLKLSVFGTTLPGAKLAFSGEGEAGIQAEVIEKRIEQETQALLKDVMVQAVHQAVDQAVGKLSAPKSVPFNEAKRKKAKPKEP